MKRSILIQLCVIVFGFTNCQRNEMQIDPTQDLFPIRYRFVSSTVNSVRAVNMTVNTYFPKISRTNLWYKNFIRVAPLDTISMTVDTTSSTKSFGYIGCTTQMEINVHYDINDSLTYVSTWVTKQDTVRKKADSKILFNWPSDTLKSKKTQSYYNNRLKFPYAGG